MRYRLRTLLIVLGIAPPVVAALWLVLPAALPVVAWLGTVAFALGALVECCRFTENQP